MAAHFMYMRAIHKDFAKIHTLHSKTMNPNKKFDLKNSPKKEKRTKEVSAQGALDPNLSSEIEISRSEGKSAKEMIYPTVFELASLATSLMKTGGVEEIDEAVQLAGTIWRKAEGYLYESSARATTNKILNIKSRKEIRESDDFRQGLAQVKINVPGLLDVWTFGEASEELFGPGEESHNKLKRMLEKHTAEVSTAVHQRTFLDWSKYLVKDLLAVNAEEVSQYYSKVRMKKRPLGAKPKKYDWSNFVELLQRHVDANHKSR